MDLAALLALVPEDKREAVEAFITSYTDKISTLSSEITALESSTATAEVQSKLDEAIRKRDAAKAQLTIVRDTLGLPAEKEITRELVAEHLKDSSKGDANKDRQIATLKDEVASLESTIEDIKAEKQAIEQERDAVTEETKFIKVFSEGMPDFKPASPIARTHVEKLMREDAVLEDGEIVYKSGDAYIRVDGEKLTMKGRLQQIQDNPDYGFLFETKASGGSGSSNAGKGGAGLSIFEQRKRAAGLK